MLLLRVLVVVGLLAVAVAPLGAQDPPPAEPAPAVPAAPPAAEPAPPVSPAPAFQRPVRSLVELGRRDVADQLELTEEQRRRVAEILAARARALDEAAPDSHAEIERSTESQLAEVLTDQQLARWVAMTEPPPAADDTAPPGERKLRFSFRFQPWADVLSWFAEQSDLSLVLDAPPPGTFNYTDSRLYTPAEAIDLLNGVLMTKGYTLIRRERMLMLLKLGQELPPDLIPEVPFAELETRGRFELVTVRFPLGKRDATAVAAEIAPLLGPHGKAVPLPQTRQLVVTETAGKMRAISAVIESIPEPDEARRPQGPDEKPELAVYPLGGADGGAAVATLEALFAGSRFVHDPKTEQIIAFATPSIQAGVKETLAQMQAEVPADKQFRLEVYPLDSDEKPQLVLEMFKALVPSAKIALDPSGEHLTVWATGPEHDTIRQTLAGIAAGTAHPGQRSVQVYKLEKSDPTTTLTMLQRLLPRVRLAVEAKSSSIVALADEEDHATIRRTVEQLEAEPAAADAPVFASYAVTRDQRARVVAALAAMTAELPGVQVLDPSGAGELNIRARPRQHELIQAIVEQLAEDVPEELRPHLVVYRLQFAEPTTVVTALASVAPDAKVTVEAKTGQLLVWAAPADQETVRTTIEQLDIDAPPARRLQLQKHALGEADPATVTQVLALVAPEAKLVGGATTGTLVVLARGEDQDLIGETIAALQPSADDPNRPRIEIYDVRKSDPSSIAAALTPAFPKARITSDTVGKRLVVFATPAEHETLRPAIETLQQPPETTGALRLAAYPFGGADLSAAINLLQAAFADARFVADSRAGTILAWAGDDVHARIQEMVGALETEVPEHLRKTTKAYHFESTDASTAMSALRGLLPYATMAVDVRTGNVLVTANAQEHKQVAESVAALEAQAAAGGRPEVRVYPIKATDPSTLLAALQQMYATRYDVRLSLDTRSQKIVAWAPPSEQENIKATIAEIDTTADNQQTLAVYQLDGADATAAVTLLQSAIPDARFVSDLKTDTILAWARGEQHPRIATLVEQLAREVPPEKQRSTRVYRLKNATAQTAVTVLQPVAPTARMAVDVGTGQLAISATGEEHADLAAALAELDAGAATADAPVVRVYALNEGDPASALAVLQQMFVSQPNVRLSLDAKTRKIVAWAGETDHAAIARTIEEIDLPRDIAETRQVEVYPLGEADGDSLRTVLAGLLGGSSDVRIVSDERNAQLIVLARPHEHATIRAMLEQMQAERPEVEVLPLRVVDAFTAETAVEDLFEGRGQARNRAPTVEADPDGQNLLVRGTPAQIAEIRRMLVKMGETFLDESVGGGGKIRVIPLPTGAAQATLDELRRVWPQMAPNPIRVVTPSALAPTLQDSREDKEPDNEAPATPAPAAEPNDSAAAGWPVDDAFCCQGPEESSAAPPAAAPSEEPAEAAPVEAPTAEAPTAEAPTAEPPPIIITVGPDSITIASDDEVALDQLEALLRSLAQRQPAAGKEFTVFTLQYASASEVADSLDRLFVQGLFSFRGGGVTIVPDQRLNALIVQAAPHDLATIENLLKILDTADVPESALAQRPRVIPIRQGDAEEVADVVREVYRTQLTARPAQQRATGGGFGGRAQEMAQVLQYLNAAAAATPEMTLSVDTTTNSLVVLAPESLFREVERLVKDLDAAALNTDRTVKVVQLRNTKGTAVQEVLEDLMRDRARGRRRFGGNNN